jgi:hypothetical protein
VTTYLELGPGEVSADLLDSCLPSGGAELLVLATARDGWRFAQVKGLRGAAVPG